MASIFVEIARSNVSKTLIARIRYYFDCGIHARPYGMKTTHPVDALLHALESEEEETEERDPFAGGRFASGESKAKCHLCP